MQILERVKHTAGVDIELRNNLWEFVRELNKNGTSVLLTTHYLEESEVLSDRVCILSNGQILLTALISELKSKHDMQSLEEVFIALTKQEEYVDQ